ncbi:MAG: MarR family winged helix-turn-helix transcriptional regulator [Solirubrobacterales bacterium]
MPYQQERMIELLRDVNRGLGKVVKEVVVSHDIPLGVMVAAREISADPGITVSELSRRTGMAKSHISNIIRALEMRGWVEKRPDPDDQRLLHLDLTPAAIQQLRLVRSHIRARLTALVEGIPAQKAADMMAGLEELQSVLKNDSARKIESGPDQSKP